MAAKLLHSLTDDNPELEKQIGCMTGIFHLFDRQHILSGSGGGGRHMVGHSPKRHSPGSFHVSGDGLERDSYGKYSDKSIQEKQRTLSELSRASFSSSSRSSSFSSLDYNRATQLEPASLDRIIFPETPSMEPEISTLKSSSPQFGRRSVDLRDFVKDSMYRELRDSPRLQSRISDGYRGSDMDRQRIRADLKESVRVFGGELQESPWYPSSEPRGLLRSSSYHAKDGSSSYSMARDAPRFSCDGREVNREPFDPRDVPKSRKDFSRFSLDVKDGVIRNLNSEYSKTNASVKSSQKGRDESDGKVQTRHQTPAKPPSVVAKLMGLEALPGSVSFGGANTGLGRSHSGKDFVKLPKSLAKVDSSKNMWKEPSSPRWRNPDTSMKPMLRVSIEPAPWKQVDGTMKPVSRTTKARVKSAPTAFPSVYREIEERLKDLEFTRSGRDLRALKQILEAMQEKGFLGTEKARGSNSTVQKNREQTLNIPMPQRDQVLGTPKRIGLSPHYESPIVIMKPANLVGKSGMPSASVISLDVLSGLPKLQDDEFLDKDLSLRSGQRNSTVNYVNSRADSSLKSTRGSTRSHQLGKDGNAGYRKSCESISPRVQHRKLETERRSRPPTPPDSAKSRRQSNKQQLVECYSPGSRRRLKYPGFPQINDQSSGFNAMSKNSNHLENEISGISNDSNIWSSKNVAAMKDSDPDISGSVGKKSMLVPSEDDSAEFGYVPPEYSSPVSVLNNVACKDNSPSPTKDVQKTLEGCNVALANAVDYFVPGSMESDSMSEINQAKLQNIDNLVLRLRRLNSSRDADYMASLCENADPDHRYISEILLASGLLSSCRFHSTENPINPDLFSVLERKKSRNVMLYAQHGPEMSSWEKLHRKLIFDTVNEILARQLLAYAGPFSDPQFQSIAGLLNAQKLLVEVCSEIEQIRPQNTKCSSISDEEDARWQNILCKDVMRQWTRWMDSDDGISGAVLGIERLIFKDLVNEIVVVESAGLKARPGRRRVLAR